MRCQGVMEAISAWKENVHGSFNLLALEIWGRLFFLGARGGVDPTTCARVSNDLDFIAHSLGGDFSVLGPGEYGCC
jgi:hypothetical protein